jgi:hypothetical protein
MRDGTYKACHLGKPSKGKWFVRDGELCLDAGEGEPDCREVWICGNKIEFRGTGFEAFCKPSRSVANAEFLPRVCALKTALKEPAQHSGDARNGTKILRGR